MSYKVLARKWRPDHFDEVVGQEHVARTLINSIEQDRVAHSYLFCGARGVGKTSTARILAKAMNCENGPQARPCYECSSCTEISSGQAVDVFEIDGASNRGINEIRELREGVRYAPSRDAKKIYIIDEVHMLTTEAFNALLKTLEEPPEHAIFIFATTEPQKIPVTILSRCQRFDFKRISQRDIVAHLEELCEHEGIEVERSALQVIARQANGGMRDALSLLDQIISFAGDKISERQITEILGVANRKHLFELSEAVLGGGAEQALLVLDDVNRYGYDLQQFASELVNHFRDLMVTAVVKEPEKVTQLTETELENARAQVEGQSSELLHRYFSVMLDGAQQMTRSSYPKLIFEMTLVRLSELEPMMKLDLLVDRLQLLETSLEDDAGGPVSWPEGASPTAASPSAGAQPAAASPAEIIEENSAGKSPDNDEPPPGKVEARVEKMARATVDADDERAEEEKPEEEKPEADEKIHVRADAPIEQESSERPPIDVYDDSDEDDNNEDDSNEDDNNEDDSNEESGEVASDIEEEEAEEAEQERVEEAPKAEEAPEAQDAPEAEEDDEKESVVGPKTAEPMKPVVLRPREEGEYKLPDADGLNDPQDRWRAVVEGLRQVNAPVAAACEYAYVQQFDDGEVILSFEEAYAELAGEEDRSAALQRVVQEIFGQHWTVELQLRDGDEILESKTLAQEREEDINRRRSELTRQLRESPAVQTAKELFDANEPRISVKLFDE